MKIALSKRACGALPLTLIALAGACADAPTVEAVADGSELVERGWERLAVKIATAPAVADDAARADRALGPDALAARAAEDPTWQARDGRRYSALFVAEDGTGYGRVDEARVMAAPTAADDHGAFDPDGAGVLESSAYIILGGGLATDRRSRVSAVTTLESYPYRTVGALSGSGNTQSGGCTGTMVGPRHVITAAHCVMGANGTVTTSGWFNPGQTNLALTNGGNSRRWSGVMLRDWRVHRRYDYALLYLENRADNAALGWMGIAWWNTSNSYVGKTAYNKGYPCGPNMTCGGIANQQCLASPRADDRCDGWMYADNALLHVGAATDDDRLEYDLDTSDGHSGSSIYTYLDGDPAVLAIHYGPDYNGTDYNAGARFRPSMWNDICTWIADVPSSYATHALCN